jgi:regulator of replication initiation timing
MEREDQEQMEVAAGLDDAEIKLMFGQDVVEKAILRKNVKALLERVSVLKKENAILREALGEKGITQDEKAT